MFPSWRLMTLFRNTPQLRGIPGAVLTLLVLIVGATVTALAWRATVRAEERSARAALAVHAADIEAQIKAHLVAYEGLLHSGAGLIDTTWPLSVEQWRSFTGQLRLATGYPGIHGVGFSVALRTPQDVEYWSRRLAPASIHRYDKEQTTAWTPESAIVLVEPLNGRNLRALGFDMMTEAVRREAVERARDQGSPALSGRITLIQELYKTIPVPAFVLNVPVYVGGGVPAHLEARRAAFRGIVYSAFRAEEFFGGNLKIPPRNAIFEVIDGESAQTGFLYRNAAAPPDVNPVDVRRLDVWGRVWTVKVWPGEALLGSLPNTALIVAGTGIAITLLLAGVVAALSLSRQRLRERMEATRAFAQRERAMKDQLELRVEQRTHELAERTSELEATNRRLSNANRDLETFSYTVSHDLRSPLRAVSGHVEMFLSSREDPAKAEHHASAIRSNVARMAQMIEDLLKLAFVSRRPLEKTIVSLDALLRSVIEDVRRAYPKPITFEYQADELGSVYADLPLLRQALTNLLMNGAKFSRDVDVPKIVVGVDRREDETIYSVHDNGVGFDPAYASKLFGVFERLHSPREFEGSGVGLAIVKQIIERHDGRVWAEAEPGRGATFYFTLGESARVSTKCKAAA